MATYADEDSGGGSQGSVDVVSDDGLEQPVDTSAAQALKTTDLSNPAQMQIIDKLRELGIGNVEGIELPQLVVVGDQSCGKSSVLEAIMEFPLPRDHKLCTRFATNIVLRRSVDSGVSVSIIPGPTKTHLMNPQAVKDFNSRRRDLKNLDGTTFLAIIYEASRAMGIIGGQETRTDDNRTFSEDVLKIELSGPEHDNLSIIDIPGIFRVGDPKKTRKEDVDLVKRLVRLYIKNESTIILAVLDASHDINNQEILAIYKEADPKGRRTLGVLTKPDRVEKGAEQGIIDLINGKRIKLALGYWIVRNRSPEELKLELSTRQRDANERELFRTAPWNVVDPERVGIRSLKLRLQQLLSQMVHDKFPKLRSDIETSLSEAQDKLARLGSDRETPEQQRLFLGDIAMRFQFIRRDAMDKMYFRHNELVDNPTTLRLPTIVAGKFDVLVKKFLHSGNFVFDDGENNDSDEEEEADDGENNDSDEEEESEVADETPDAEVDSVDRRSESVAEEDAAVESSPSTTADDTTYPELENITMETHYQSAPPEMDAKKWIEREYRAARGYDLEVLNANILPLLWRTQSGNWGSVTKLFMDDMIRVIHTYIYSMLANLCPGDRTFDTLGEFILDEVLERYKIALHHVELIIKIERSGGLITKNRYFAETLSKIRTKTAETKWKGLASSTASKDGAKSVDWVQLSDIAKPQTNKSNIKQAVDDMHSVLMVYHKVARKRVVDNIIQTVDFFLLSGDNSPLNILTPMYISERTDAQLEQIAGEDDVSKNRRRNLKELIKKLKLAARVVRGQWKPELESGGEGAARLVEKFAFLSLAERRR